MEILIRQATEKDIPAIIELLKLSLGETSSKKTIAYWEWKHLQNPFGASPVLIAEFSGQLVGVRAMMQWKWQTQHQSFNSLRAVDTATHPEYQGKGIFKNLTLAFIENAQRQQFSFIFNTPNKQSLPGYLKMGWMELGRVRVYLKPIFPNLYQTELYWERYQEQLINWDPKNISTKEIKNLHTPKSLDYLIWRYRQCPIKEYGLIVGELQTNKYWIFVKRKKRKGFVEFRVCDYFMEGLLDKNIILKLTTNAAKKVGAHFLTISLCGSLQKQISWKDGLINLKKKSPILTFLQLKNEVGFPNFQILPNWSYQIGDLELF